MEDIKKNATLVDFIHTDARLGMKDGEIVVTSVVRIQFEKIGIDINGAYSIYRKKFPFISRHGVFTVAGKAVCGNEPFDFTKGCNIAEARAQQKAHSITKRVLSLMLHEIVSIGDNIAKVMTNNSKCIENCDSHIAKLDE